MAEATRGYFCSLRLSPKAAVEGVTKPGLSPALMLGEFTLTWGAASPGWGWRIARMWGGVGRPGGCGVPPVGPCRVWGVK